MVIGNSRLSEELERFPNWPERSVFRVSQESQWKYALTHGPDKKTAGFRGGVDVRNRQSPHSESFYKPTSSMKSISGPFFIKVDRLWTTLHFYKSLESGYMDRVHRVDRFFIPNIK